MALKKRPLDPEEAKLRMAGLCARSEQCEFDIANKLFKLGLSSHKVKEIINFLKDEKFLDNLRYAKSFASDKCRFSRWGKYKIRMTLATKRISSADISCALDRVPEEDWELAVMEAAIVKSKSLNFEGENAYKEKVKLYRHLLSRGFESERAMRAVKKIVKESKDD